MKFDVGSKRRPRTHRAKQSQFFDCGLRIGDRVVAGPPGLRPAASGLHGPIVQNEPNFRRAAVSHHSSIPLFQHSSPMPVVRNKANFRMRQNEVNYCCGKWLRELWGTWRSCKTKPISHRAGWDGASGNRANDAKRSQSAVGGSAMDAGRQGRPCRHRRARACKTNPIWWGQMCETNPIVAAPAVGTTHHSTIPSFRDSSPPAAGPGAIARNKANSRQSRVGRGRRDGGVGCCTNKANLPRTDWKRRWAEAENAAADGDKRAKRSQFSPRADTMDLEYATVCRPHRGLPAVGIRSFSALTPVGAGTILARFICPRIAAIELGSPTRMDALGGPLPQMAGRNSQVRLG